MSENEADEIRPQPRELEQDGAKAMHLDERVRDLELRFAWYKGAFWTTGILLASIIGLTYSITVLFSIPRAATAKVEELAKNATFYAQPHTASAEGQVSIIREPKTRKPIRFSSEGRGSGSWRARHLLLDRNIYGPTRSA